MLKDKINFGTVLSISLTDQLAPAHLDIPVSPALDILYTFPTDRSFWVNLSPYGFFGWPEGHKRWLDVGLFRDAAKRDWSLIWVDSHPDFPDWAWVLPFESLVATTDAQGNHLGQHPKGAWLMPKSLWDNWITGKFPTTIKLKGVVGGYTTLRIRDSAGTGAAILGTLAIGDNFTLLPDAPKSANGYTWRRIQHGSLIGWIAYSLVIT